MKKLISCVLALLMVGNTVWGYEGEKLTYFNGTAPLNAEFDTVHPSFFDIDEDGKLKINVNEKVIKTYKDKGVRVEPYLSNHWNRESGSVALNNRKDLAKQVAGAVLEHGLDGVNVDIENISHELKAEYVDFVRQLKGLLPNKRVSVAVAANPEGWQNGWHGSYDCRALGQIADYIVLMGYDESYYGSEEGQVAGSEWINKSILQLLKDVPASKVVLSIPFYGRGWSEDGSLKGFSVSGAEVEMLYALYGGEKGYDVETRSAYLRFTVPHNGPFPSVIGAKNLPSGNYTIWYDDERSARFKLSLAEKYGLMGVDSWAFGQNSDEFLQIFDKNFTYFDDIFNHWAKNDIEIAYEENLIAGKEKDVFDTEGKMTRAEAVTILCRFMDKAKDVSSTRMEDTKEHWAENYIGIALENGWVRGVDDKRFMPDKEISRQDFSVMLANTMTVINGNGGCFYDVGADLYSCNAICHLKALGVIEGYDDGGFKPFNQITRAEGVSLIMRLKKL